MYSTGENFPIQIIRLSIIVVKVTSSREHNRWAQVYIDRCPVTRRRLLPIGQMALAIRTPESTVCSPCYTEAISGHTYLLVILVALLVRCTCLRFRLEAVYTFTIQSGRCFVTPRGVWSLTTTHIVQAMSGCHPHIIRSSVNH